MAQLTLLLAAVVALIVGLSYGFNKQTLDRVAGEASKISGQIQTAIGMSHPAASPGEASPQPGVAAAGDAETQSRVAVESYMQSHSLPGCTLSFLDWSDFATSGAESAITLHYQVQQPGRPDVLATVRFTLQGAAVVKAAVSQSRVQMVEPFPAPVRPAPAQPLEQVQLATPPPVVIDHFSEAIYSARNGEPMTLHPSSAYSLSQLDEAKAAARTQRKPLGFIMVWDQFFKHEANPREAGSESAMVHFYEVFNDQLVLVFVRHESELDNVPPAVAKGFRGPDEGGYAPNMAVTDASAGEFIVEVPFRNQDASGREAIFTECGKKIDQWLATHPDAMGAPSSGG